VRTSRNKAGSFWGAGTNPDAVNQATTGKAGLLHVAEAGSVTGKNWPQNVFTDIPIIEASFWLTVAGTAR
jgi:hypothetical protein